MIMCVVVRSVRRARSFWAVVHLQTRAKSSRSNCHLSHKVPSLSRSDEIRRRTYLYQRHRTRLRASPRPLLSVFSGLLEQRRAVDLVLGRPAEGHALRRPERPVEHLPRISEDGSRAKSDGAPRQRTLVARVPGDARPPSRGTAAARASATRPAAASALSAPAAAAATSRARVSRTASMKAAASARVRCHRLASKNSRMMRSSRAALLLSSTRS